MAIEAIGLDQIHDNPYQARLTYHKKDIDELVHSIQTHGLLQVPPGRRKDGDVELAFGHLRKRAFDKLAKKDPVGFGKMPIDIKSLSDDQMAMFALEENLKRRGISPLETARAVDKYLVSFPGKTEVELAESLNMAKGTVSNMRRVLRLPEKILEKIDEGIISFHQGRELLIFERFENAENLMRSSLDGLKTGNKYYGQPNTVEGLQKSIDSVISGQCRPLDKEWEGHRWDILFDTRAAGCLECDKMLRTHPTKSATAHYCTDAECWDRHQEERREKAAVAAKAKMEAEVINRAALVIAQEEKMPAPVMIDENTVLVDQETFTKLEASNSCDRISEGAAVRKPVKFEGKLYVAASSGMGKVEAYQLVPKEEFTGKVRTYRVPKGREYDEYYDSLRNDPNGFYHGMLAKRGQVEHVLVGPPVTFVTKEAEQKRKAIPVVADAGGVVMPVPCESCAKVDTCDRTHFHVATDGSGQLVCEQKVQAAKEILPVATEIPEDILALVREKAGTRAEVLDLNDICYGDGYSRRVKQGYALLDDELRLVDDPVECLERCTHGFHYAFDSKARDPQRVLHVCSDTKCLAKKKGAFTRKVNAEGQARKKAETKAIKEAIAQVSTLGRGEIKLVLLTQIRGKHLASYYYGGDGVKKAEKWLWDKVSAGTADLDRDTESLFKKIDKLDDVALAQLVVEFMLYYLLDHGDVGSYEIKTELPLSWLGVKIELEPEKEANHEQS